MKKLVAFVLAALLCLCAAAALAENVELTTTDDGLTIATPIGWSALELDEDNYESGYAFWLVDEDEERVMMMRVEEADASYTNEDIAQMLNEDEDYAMAQLMTNEFGQELVLYAFADETIVGYCFVDGEGLLYDFLFLHADGSAISGDAGLLAAAEECAGYTVLEDAVAYADEPAAYTGDSDAALELVSIEDGPTFPYPADWTEDELDESDVEDGCIAQWSDEANGYSMLVMANELGAVTTAQLAAELEGDTDYAMTRLMTNQHGLDVILFVDADLSICGYCFVGEDEWMYTFLFGNEDGNVTQDEALTRLVESCLNNTYFE
jgi:hypothetical protein